MSKTDLETKELREKNKFTCRKVFIGVQILAKLVKILKIENWLGIYQIYSECSW